MWLITPSLITAAVYATGDHFLTRFALALALLAGFISLSGLLFDSGHNPAGFTITSQGAFAALPRYHRFAVAAGFMNAMPIAMAGTTLRPMMNALLWFAVGAAWTTALAVTAIQLRYGRPLLLRRDGIEVPEGTWILPVAMFDRRTFLPWEAIDPRWTGTTVWRTIDLPIGRPDLVAPGQPNYRIPFVGLDVAKPFLVHAILTYVREPERRAAIGTPEELAQLTGRMVKDLS